MFQFPFFLVFEGNGTLNLNRLVPLSIMLDSTLFKIFLRPTCQTIMMISELMVSLKYNFSLGILIWFALDKFWLCKGGLLYVVLWVLVVLCQFFWDQGPLPTYLIKNNEIDNKSLTFQKSFRKCDLELFLFLIFYS